MAITSRRSSPERASEPQSWAPPGSRTSSRRSPKFSGDDADTPAHWSVTFSTENADVTAAKAADLGGTVLVAPVDAPYSRLTVLRDPQGATFSATAFVLENKDVGREIA